MTGRSDRAAPDSDAMRAMRMEAIARVAGGVAHDFNNILTSIIGAADLSLGVDGLPAEVRSDLENIRAEGRRAAALTRQMLTFSRQQVAHPRRIDVNEVVLASEPLVRRLIPESVKVVFDAKATGTVTADPAQLEQALTCLVANAGDAMASGGTLSVATSDVTLSDALVVNGRAVPAGAYAVIRVR
ncbi:MAG TPA: histidine kinase dimerization/phospho-acceptor domain-containing protein, partial [Gemmatimonadaceae bacterium]